MVLVLHHSGVPKDKIDRKPPSIYGKNINKWKEKLDHEEIRTADRLITPTAPPFSGERQSTPGPINYPDLVAHKQNPYQLTRFASSPNKVQWVAGVP